MSAVVQHAPPPASCRSGPFEEPARNHVCGPTQVAMSVARAAGILSDLGRSGLHPLGDRAADMVARRPSPWGAICGIPRSGRGEARPWRIAGTDAIAAEKSAAACPPAPVPPRLFFLVSHETINRLWTMKLVLVGDDGWPSVTHTALDGRSAPERPPARGQRPQRSRTALGRAPRRRSRVGRGRPVPASFSRPAAGWTPTTLRGAVAGLPCRPVPGVGGPSADRAAAAGGRTVGRFDRPTACARNGGIACERRLETSAFPPAPSPTGA